MNVFGDYAVHCASEVGVKFLHDFVRDVLMDICYKGGVPARKEAPLRLLSDQHTPLKPADILVHSWEDGRDTCFDVTGVSPFTGNGICSFTPGHAISAAVTRKNSKYLAQCISHDFEFKVLAFTILGELGDDMIVFLQRLKNCISSHDEIVK